MQCPYPQPRNMDTAILRGVETFQQAGASLPRNDIVKPYAIFTSIYYYPNISFLDLELKVPLSGTQSSKARYWDRTSALKELQSSALPTWLTGRTYKKRANRPLPVDSNLLLLCPSYPTGSLPLGAMAQLPRSSCVVGMTTVGGINCHCFLNI